MINELHSRLVLSALRVPCKGLAVQASITGTNQNALHFSNLLDPEMLFKQIIIIIINEKIKVA